jgi:hypothetical protein
MPTCYTLLPCGGGCVGDGGGYLWIRFCNPNVLILASIYDDYGTEQPSNPSLFALMIVISMHQNDDNAKKDARC